MTTQSPANSRAFVYLYLRGNAESFKIKYYLLFSPQCNTNKNTRYQHNNNSHKQICTRVDRRRLIPSNDLQPYKINRQNERNHQKCVSSLFLIGIESHICYQVSSRKWCL